MSKRTKIFLSIFQVYITLNAVNIVQNHETEKANNEILTWANKNRVILSYDYPEKVNRIPNFLKGFAKKLIKLELTSIRINESDIESFLKSHKSIILKLSQLETIFIDSEVSPESINKVQGDYPEFRFILDEGSKS